MRRAIQCLDLSATEEREEAQHLADIAIVRVDPKLIELERRRALRVEPDRARLSLAEFRARCRREKLEGEGMCLGADRAANELDPRGDVAPLIAAAHLQRYRVALMQLQVIV